MLTIITLAIPIIVSLCSCTTLSKIRWKQWYTFATLDRFLPPGKHTVQLSNCVDHRHVNHATAYSYLLFEFKSVFAIVHIDDLPVNDHACAHVVWEISSKHAKTTFSSVVSYVWLFLERKLLLDWAFSALVHVSALHNSGWSGGF